MKFNSLIFFSILSINLIFLIIPIFLLYNDLWDGVIIEYASKSKNFNGLEVYFFESGWFLQYYFSLIVISLADFFLLSYKNLNAVIIYILFTIFLYENLYISRNIFKFKKIYQIWFLLILITFPPFSIYISSIMTFHLLCFSFTLMGIRLIHTQKNLFIKFIGYTLIIISFNLNSLLVFSPILSFCYDYFKNKKYSLSINTLLILLQAIIIYSLRSYFNPTGLYENYNNLILFDNNVIKLLANGIYYFFTFPMIIIFLNFILIMTFFILDIKIDKNRYKIKFLFIQLLPVLLLFIGASIPYIAVGKWVGYWDLKDWSARQAILMSVPFGLFTIILTSNLINFFIIKEKLKNIIISTFIILILIFNSSLFINSIIFKMNRNIFENTLEISLKNNLEKTIEPGYVHIYGKGVPTPNLRIFESNYLLYRTFNQRAYYSYVADEKNDKFQIEKALLTDEKYKIKYIFDDNFKCETYINLKIKNFNSLNDSYKNVLRIQKPKVIINNVKEEC